MSKRLLANVNESTFKQIKIAFVDRNITMQDAIVTAILQYLGLDISLEEATKGMNEESVTQIDRNAIPKTVRGGV